MLRQVTKLYKSMVKIRKATPPHESILLDSSITLAGFWDKKLFNNLFPTLNVLFTSVLLQLVACKSAPYLLQNLSVISILLPHFSQTYL